MDTTREDPTSEPPHRGRKAPDLRGVDLEKLPEWDPQAPQQSLDGLFEHFALRNLNASIDWYFARRKGKRTMGRMVRVFAICAAGFGVAIPLLSELVERGGAPVIPAGWAAVALLVGAGLVWMDSFLDGTSGWLRYVSTGLALVELRDEAVLDWREHASGWREPLDQGQIGAAFALLRDVEERRKALVRAETEEWEQSFRSSIRQLDGVVRARLEKSEETLAKLREQRSQAPAAGDGEATLASKSPGEGAAPAPATAPSPGSAPSDTVDATSN